MSWEEVNIGYNCEVLSAKRIFAKDYVDSGIPFYRSKEIIYKAFNQFEGDEVFIKEERFNEIKNKFGAPKKGDVLISSVGNRSGISYWVKDEYDFYFKDGNLIWFRNFNDVMSSKYLVYFLNSELGQAKINNMFIGAAQKALTIIGVKSIKLPLPPIKTQKRIADILSAYDDLIENNLKRIKLLEQAAQNIYKEWFVNLRFPGHENTPINEETGLPEGWEIGIISDFGKVVTGKTPSTKRSDFYGGHIPFIKTPDMHGLPYVIETSNNLTELGQQAQLNKSIPANTVLVSCIGTAGVVAMTSKLSQTNQQINSVVFESTFKSYYFYCFAKTLRPLLEGLGSNGATMVNVNKGKFENVDLNIPIEGLLVEYAKIAEPMFNQMLTLSIQNQKLKAARDILLPRLMNRTIEV